MRAIDDAIAAGVVRGDIEPSRLKVVLRGMMRSVSREIDPSRMDDVTDDTVKLLLSGVLAPTN